MPVIRIDDEVWEALQRLATPLEDSPNRVLRRLLGLAGRRAPRAADVELGLPCLRWDIAQTLRWQCRGPATTEELLAAMNRALAFSLPNAALQWDESGQPRWWTYIHAEIERTEAGTRVMPGDTCGSDPSRAKGRSPGPSAPRGCRPSPSRD